MTVEGLLLNTNLKKTTYNGWSFLMLNLPVIHQFRCAQNRADNKSNNTAIAQNEVFADNSHIGCGEQYLV